MPFFATAVTSKVCPPQTSWGSESANRVCGDVALPTAEEDSDVALELIGCTAASGTRQGTSRGAEGLACCHCKATWQSGEVPGDWKRASIVLIFSTVKCLY